MLTNRAGYKLLRILRGAEKHLTATYDPITAALTVVAYDAKVLLGFNRFRQQWEIPGGRRNAGESLRDCARRELLEESAQTPSKLCFKALAEVIRPSGLKKYTSLYLTHLNHLGPFAGTSEWQRIHLWDLKEDIGYIDEIDREFVYDCSKEI